MVTQAIQSDLFQRLQKYVANNMNSKHSVVSMQPPVQPQHIQILYFTRVLNHWTALVTAPADKAVYYDITYDGLAAKTIVKIYELKTTEQAII